MSGVCIFIAGGKVDGISFGEEAYPFSGQEVQLLGAAVGLPAVHAHTLATLLRRCGLRLASVWEPLRLKATDIAAVVAECHRC